MKSINGQTSFVGKRKHCLSCVPQSFLWQEGHTAHENEEDARQRTMKVLDEYARLCEEFLAIPVYRGKKPLLSVLLEQLILIQSKR